MKNLVRNKNKKVSKQLKYNTYQISKKSPSGLKEYIVKSNHPLLKKQFLQKSMSKIDRDFDTIEKGHQKEILDNLVGIDMQLKGLTERVVHQEQTQSKFDCFEGSVSILI